MNKPENDLSSAQATDLAHYFLGPEWCASQIAGVRFLHYRGDITASSNTTWREAFLMAGVVLPQPRGGHFAQVGSGVMLGAEFVCTCTSKTMARRVAAALNDYKPGRRGY